MQNSASCWVPPLFMWNQHNINYPAELLWELQWTYRKSLKQSLIHSTWSLKVRFLLLSSVWLFVTPWTVACQSPPYKEFPWQEYWSGLPFPSPGDLPNPGIKPGSPTLVGRFLTTEPLGNAKNLIKYSLSHYNSAKGYNSLFLDK